MFKNIDRIILYALLVGVAVIIFLMIRNNKNMNAQSSLLMAMADKLNLNDRTNEQEIIEDQVIKIKEDDSETVRIAEKLYFNKPLTKKENQYYSEFTEAIDAEYNFSNQFHPLVEKFVNGSSEFTPQEKEFYEANKELIDEEVQNKKSGIEPESTEFQSQVPSTINHEPSTVLQGANPPLAPGERLKKILSLFEDGIPKNVTEIAELYSQKTGSKVNKGNMSTIFGKLEGKQLLCQEIKNNSRWKVYYGLPEWFDGKKLKPEYKNKIV